MNRTLIYLVGAPGCGKSTLMSRLTAPYHRLPISSPVPHDALVDPQTGEVERAEIGRRRDAFSGTDALASTIIERAVPWVYARPYRQLLGEGARLGNYRFLAAAHDAGYSVTLALLDHPDAEAWRWLRSQALGKTQNPSWVMGRLTASRNLADNPPHGVTVLRGHPDDLQPRLYELIHE